MFAAALVDAGHHVTLAGRTPFTQLEVHHPHGTATSEVTFVDSPNDLQPVPLVVLATKAYQVDAAGDLLRARCDGGTVLAVLQNGIGHADRVRPWVGHDVDVLATMVACPADRTSPGRVEVRGSAILEVLGSPGGRRFAQAFDGSFATVRTVDDIHTSLWRKLLLNAIGGGIGVLARKSNSLFVGDDGALALARDLAEEVLAVAQADGAQLDADTVDTLIRGLSGGSTHLPSIVVDRISGQPTEWQVRNDVVVRKGVEHGVPVPLCQMLSTLIRLGEPSGATTPGLPRR